MSGAGSRTADRISIVLLSVSIFATGLSGLVSEFVLGTVSSYILGNSIEQFSIVIALMMLMMGIAGLCQRLLPDRHLAVQFLGVEALRRRLRFETLHPLTDVLVREGRWDPTETEPDTTHGDGVASTRQAGGDRS